MQVTERSCESVKHKCRPTSEGLLHVAAGITGHPDQSSQNSRKHLLPIVQTANPANVRGAPTKFVLRERWIKVHQANRRPGRETVQELSSWPS